MIRRHHMFHLAVAVTAATLTVFPTLPAANANDGASPAWCAADAELRLGTIPDYLPAADCSVVGRTLIGSDGAVKAPDVGFGLALSGGGTTISAWTDEAGTHLSGDFLSAAIGYADEVATRVGVGGEPTEDLRNKVDALRTQVYRRAHDYRTEPSQVDVLDAVDQLGQWSRGEDVQAAGAVGMVEAFLRHVAEMGEVVGLPEVAAHIDAGLAYVNRVEDVTDGVSTNVLVGADHLLTDLLAVGSYLTDLAYEANNETDELIAELRDSADLVRLGIANGQEPNDELRDRIAGNLTMAGGLISRSVDEPLLTEPTISPQVPADIEQVTTTTSPSPCKDRAYKTFKGQPRWARGATVKWYYNYRGQPYYNSSEYQAALSRAFTNMTAMRDNCGIAKRPNVNHSYAGLTDLTANFAYIQGPICWRDSRSYRTIFDWEEFGGGGKYGAFTCPFWTSAGRYTGFHVTVNSDISWDIPETGKFVCDTRRDYDYEAVLTHEDGHGLGLDHVDEATHANLTMSEVGDLPCKRGNRTPGLGDWLGLRALYGEV